MSYIHQINRAIDYIEDNLAYPLRVEDIAKAAGLSRWYFQKIFQAMLGETIKGYISRRRLVTAAMALRESSDKIVDIAFAQGFESHEVFCRAFKRIFSMAPTDFRNANVTQIIIPPKPRVTIDYLTHLYGGMSMQPQLISIEQSNAVGITAEISPENAMKVIPDLWQIFRANMQKITGLANAQRIAVIDAIEGESPTARLEYLAGAVWEDLDDLPDGFSIRTVEKGEYANFLHKGPVTKFAHTLNYIYGSWLPNSGRERAEGPEFALYGKTFNPHAADAEVQIYIPLK